MKECIEYSDKWHKAGWEDAKIVLRCKIDKAKKLYPLDNSLDWLIKELGE